MKPYIIVSGTYLQYFRYMELLLVLKTTFTICIDYFEQNLLYHPAKLSFQITEGTL